jgi:hypothetical protein
MNKAKRVRKDGKQESSQPQARKFGGPAENQNPAGGEDKQQTAMSRHPGILAKFPFGIKLFVEAFGRRANEVIALIDSEIQHEKDDAQKGRLFLLRAQIQALIDAGEHLVMHIFMEVCPPLARVVLPAAAPAAAPVEQPATAPAAAVPPSAAAPSEQPASGAAPAATEEPLVVRCPFYNMGPVNDLHEEVLRSIAFMELLAQKAEPQLPDGERLPDEDRRSGNIRNGVHMLASKVESALKDASHALIDEYERAAKQASRAATPAPAQS